jgi:hypothetical protein
MPLQPATSIIWVAHLHFKLAGKWSDHTRETFIWRNNSTTIWRKSPGRPRLQSMSKSAHVSPAGGPQLVRIDRSAATREELQSRSQAGAPAATFRRSLWQMELPFRRVLRPSLERVCAARPGQRHSTLRRAEPALNPAILDCLRSPAALQSSPQHAQLAQFSAVPRLALSQPSASPMTSARRAPELVWRKAQKADPGALQTFPVTDRSYSPLSPILSTSGSGAVARVAPSTDRASVERALPPDPAFLERIAEDVIRRVQRHARIERERRGV